MNVMLGSKTQSAVEIDDYDLKEALQQVSKFGTDRFGYVVTPNVDHIIRHHYDQSFRDLYAQASYVFLDSRFLAHIIVWVKQRILRVCRGSDLTAAVLSSVIQPSDTVVLVGSTVAQAQLLREKYGLEALHHINPPMNFIRDPVAVEACLQQIEAVGKFRFCFLAIGSPQQEILAQLLKARGKARGLALCVGASIDFVTGIERRAPGWMQEAGFEWLYRLTRNPRRLWRRYLVRGPRIFLLLWQIELRIRRAANLPETIPEQPLPSSPAASGALPIVAAPTS
jgi:exopolysaccharide biosynthesis WecB/TagA/CpsF family protein